MYNITPENSLKLVEALEQEGFDLERWEELHTRYKTGLLGGYSKWEIASQLMALETKLERAYRNGVG